eukprot:TRINITY_DN505_c0_g1_i5.p1 TRINITY_DN505_c0_g1~~TRINITY_DN505_c0_g1_i5.p1  ORF type:complete len:903 (-),score=172.70 TRINITY_DN505_c0_g1_i5:427-3135(-)
MNSRESIDTVSFTQNVEEEERREEKINVKTFMLLSLNALGVVYGDIGTSPLYVMNTIFHDPPSPVDAIGACSLIIWALIIMVTLKYIVFIMSADHHNEGGIFALCSLLIKKSSSMHATGKKVVIVLGMIGASLLLGDGAITPAISVISAIEGMAIAYPGLTQYVVPITVIILVLLFLAQPLGTAKVGTFFGPIVFVWFGFLFGIGVYNVTLEPRALYAFNPWEGLSFFVRHGPASYFTMGSIFLCVTGMEAMFADMGHFRKGPIRLAWMTVVFPAVVFNYLGQTAVLILRPEVYSSPFYSSVPHSLYWLIFALATLAGIIASQAIITGSFSVISQAIWLGLSPPFQIKQTSTTVEGQIFIPTVNWTLMIATIGVVCGFGSSEAISHAYGVTVCTNEVLSSVLFFLVLKYSWRVQTWKCLPFLLFLFVDGSFWGAIMAKLPHGGYAAIILSLIFFSVMMIWFVGEKKLRTYRKVHNISTRLEVLQDRLSFPEGSNYAFRRVTEQFHDEEDEREIRGVSRPSLDYGFHQIKIPDKNATYRGNSLDRSRTEKRETTNTSRKNSLEERKEGSRKPSMEAVRPDELSSTSPEESSGETTQSSPSPKSSRRGEEETKAKKETPQNSPSPKSSRRGEEEAKAKRETPQNSPSPKSSRRGEEEAKAKRETPQNSPSPKSSRKGDEEISMTVVKIPQELQKEKQSTSEEDEQKVRKRRKSTASQSQDAHHHVSLLPEPCIFQIEMYDGTGNMNQHNITTLPFAGVFLSHTHIKTPVAFEIFLDRISGLPRIVIFLKLNKSSTPFVSDEDRVRVKELFDSVYMVTLSIGYAEHSTPTTLLEILTSEVGGLPPLSSEEITIFVPADTIQVVNRNYALRFILWIYATMKSIFFGAQRIKLPSGNSVYLATAATL